MFHIQRQLALAGLDDAASRVVGAQRPVLQVEPRPDVRFQERAFEIGPAARRSQQDIGTVADVIPFPRRTDAASFLVGHHAAARQESRRQPQIQMRCAKVRLDLVRVQMLPRFAVQFQVDRLRPVKEVLRRRAGDPADAVPEHAEVAHVLLFAVRPERIVLRIEGPLGDHRLRLQFPPVDSVGRRKGDQTGLPGSAECLVPLVGRGGRIRIDKRREIVTAPMPRQHDVVVLRPLHLEQAQLGPRPVDPVAALGDASDFHVQRMPRDRHAPVVEPKQVAILQHRLVSAVQSLPRLVELQHDLARLRRMQPKPRPPPAGRSAARAATVPRRRRLPVPCPRPSVSGRPA